MGMQVQIKKKIYIYIINKTATTTSSEGRLWNTNYVQQEVMPTACGPGSVS